MNKYTATCKKCGMKIDENSDHITEGYICSTCKTVHPIKFWFIRANSVDGKTFIKRFHTNNISHALKTLGLYGWIPSEVLQIRFDRPNFPASMTRIQTGKDNNHHPAFNGR